MTVWRIDRRINSVVIEEAVMGAANIVIVSAYDLTRCIDAIGDSTDTARRIDRRINSVVFEEAVILTVAALVIANDLPRVVNALRDGLATTVWVIDRFVDIVFRRFHFSPHPPALNAAVYCGLLQSRRASIFWT